MKSSHCSGKKPNTSRKFGFSFLFFRIKDGLTSGRSLTTGPFAPSGSSLRRSIFPTRNETPNTKQKSDPRWKSLVASPTVGLISQFIPGTLAGFKIIGERLRFDKNKRRSSQKSATQFAKNKTRRRSSRKTNRLDCTLVHQRALS